MIFYLLVSWNFIFLFINFFTYLKQVCDFFLYMVLQVGQPVLLFSKCLRMQALQTAKKFVVNIKRLKNYKKSFSLHLLSKKKINLKRQPPKFSLLIL